MEIHKIMAWQNNNSQVVSCMTALVIHEKWEQIEGGGAILILDYYLYDVSRIMEDDLHTQKMEDNVYNYLPGNIKTTQS